MNADLRAEDTARLIRAARTYAESVGGEVRAVVGRLSDARLLEVIRPATTYLGVAWKVRKYVRSHRGSTPDGPHQTVHSR